MAHSPDEPSTPLNISGRVAQAFLVSQITPLLALAGLLLGVLAIVITPREEEPQINVTFANVLIPFPGASAREVEQLVTTPAEQVLSEIEGVKHIYSISQPGMAVLTVRFEVGENRTDAIVRLYSKVFSNLDWLPANLGVGQPLIKPKGIDDVPIVTLTLWSENPDKSVADLQHVAHTVEAELKRVKGTRDVYTVGTLDEVVHVVLDPVKLAGYQLSLSNLRYALNASNITQNAGTVVQGDAELLVQAGEFLSSVEDIGDLVVGVQGSSAIRLRDVADVRAQTDQAERYVWFTVGPGMAQPHGAHGDAHSQDDQHAAPLAGTEFPAVTVAVAKQPGVNAVEVANQVITRFEQMKGVFVPEDIHASVTRNYGATADAKAKKLINKLMFATASVVLLVLIALGWREALIVGSAVIITLLITLFASWAWGFTLNRVSLFALIFSIGILVDDAIVVVENIHRHMHLYGKPLLRTIPPAVDEVGGPTILATLTVIAALLPMAFVSGLMGPYMSPIPINASFGMIISLAVAFVITPWLFYQVFGNATAPGHAATEPGTNSPSAREGFTLRLFRFTMTPFLRAERGRGARFALTIVVLALIGGALLLPVLQLVVLKMLPFDNKSEFQVVVDMPEGTSVERTANVLHELGAYLAGIPEVSDLQAYAGTAAPINFNGLVRQYYLRNAAHMGDIQVNLVDKHHRLRKSHEIALAVRVPLQEIGRKFDANVKIVEVPPGPPVQSPLVAEIYGLDHHGQARVAQHVRQVFAQGADIIDVDDSSEAPQRKLIVRVDQQKAGLLGVPQETAVAAVRTALHGEDVGYLHNAEVKYPIPIRLEFSVTDKADRAGLQALRVHNRDGQLVPLAEFTEIIETTREMSIYHKDLLPIMYVTGDMAGTLDSPLYGMFNLSATLNQPSVDGEPPLRQWFFTPPENPYQYSLKWDGEWQVTFETFRDMGLAYAVGMILIYFLVVAQFQSYITPLIIMAPIPLTLVGVMPGHALLGAQFTATSMIGMIALAGIIVRNSILLVDFINQQTESGMAFQEAVIQAGAVRAKPILLTGLAAMLGAFFIVDDPIFNGLAVALIFGILVSTLLTLLVIPVLYYAFRYRAMAKQR